MGFRCFAYDGVSVLTTGWLGEPQGLYKHVSEFKSPAGI
jgi:hypothetical protein